MLHAPPRDPSPVTTAIRCPKCKGGNLYLTEVGEWTTQWDIEGGAFDRSDGSHEPGAVNHIEARCKSCQHRWRLRGRYSIDDIVS